MPSRSGLEAIPELRRVAPGAQIVVFSGFASASVAEQVLALGAASYLEKGADPEAIVATIEEALANAPSLPAGLLHALVSADIGRYPAAMAIGEHEGDQRRPRTASSSG